MQMYSMMRAFADSWALVSLTLVFLAIVAWAFRPGSAGVHKESADIPFRHEVRPLAPAVEEKP
jgi:cytochrome c oxidase cbb3-type subunit IV